MALLTRTVRFAINPPGVADSLEDANGFAGRPAMRGLGRYYEIEVTCEGSPDPRTGYLISIREIDVAVRQGAAPLIAQACLERPSIEPSALLAELLAAISDRLAAPVREVRWKLTPYYCVTMSASETQRFLLRQRFDFAAAHRLHVDSLSESENRAVFGRCNNPSAHGHNYQVEPAVEIELSSGAPAITLQDVERVTMATLIDRFDHKNLSKDSPEFAPPGGVNPTVENIARVFFSMLAPEIEKAAPGRARLRSLTVWETDRTSCTCEAGA